jgi:hypothetical protein
MTERKRTQEGSYSRLELAQYRIRKIAKVIEDGAPLPPDDLKFLVEALWRIGKGEDANEILQVKAKRGERKTHEQVFKRDKMRFALLWIAGAIRPEEEDGLGMSLDDAIASAATMRRGEANFGLSEDTLRTYWKSHPEWRSPSLPRPISSFPDRDPKKNLR